MTTEAIVVRGVRDVALDTLPARPPAPGEVQIRTALSVISPGTEGWLLQGEDLSMVQIRFPYVPGYQRVGTVVAVGGDVETWEPGDRVAATGSRWDGEPHAMWGAHIAVANTAVENVYRLDGIDDVDAAAAVVAQVGYNAANRLRNFVAGDWVLVYGDGLIGQFGAQAARARGGRVILAGHRKDRLALAAAHSADHVIDDRDSRFVERVREWIGAERLKAVIDTVHAESAQPAYVRLLQPEIGEVVYSGHARTTVWADMALFQKNEITTHYIVGLTRPRMEATFDLLAQGRMRMRPFVTHEVAPAEAPRMYEMILEKTEPHLGIVFDWRS